LNKIKEDFGDLFTGLGCMKEEYHIQMKDNVKPVVHAPRKAPHTTRDKLKDTLDKMSNDLIIAPVDIPTDWVSSLVVVDKGTKLRLCIDPKDLN